MLLGRCLFAPETLPVGSWYDPCGLLGLLRLLVRSLWAHCGLLGRSLKSLTSLSRHFHGGTRRDLAIRILAKSVPPR